jgi:ADP-dependent NAD(P)H-hydrate dehydratase / NAD(P)H-hydrate epimerase
MGLLSDIGIHKDFISEVNCDKYLVDSEFCRQFIKGRQKFDHKGTFGHALIIAGSYGKMGAAVLSARACLRSGVGLLTVNVPKCGYEILQTSVPEAMTDTCEDVDFGLYSAIGIGPGIGTDETAIKKVLSLLKYCKQHQDLEPRLIVDADGLNILSQHKELIKELPKNTILTPHPKEFARLFGEFDNDFERLSNQIELSIEYSIYIIYKIANTIITTPEGKVFINSSGNPGMATGGSGDVLTGIITGLSARGYNPEESCVLGVYLHGLSGDIAAKERGQEALIAGDIIEAIGKSLKKIK